MKILFLANRYTTILLFRRELLERLCASGHEVYVSMPFDKEKYMDILKGMGCRLIDAPVERRGTNPIADFKLFLYYVKIMKSIKPHLVLTYTIKPNIYGNISAKICKIPCMSTITGLGSAFQKENLSKKIITFLYRHSLPFAKKVFVQNEGIGSTLVSLGVICENQKILTPGSGVNTSKFVYEEYPGPEKINFLFIGRIMKEKGIDELFRAVKEIKKKYSHVIFSFIGRDEFDYTEKIKEMTEGKYIEYYGFQDDTVPFIKKSHCVVIPSYHEGMNNSLLEAGSVGRPVITTDIYGCRETLVDGKTGFLCKVKNWESLFFALEKFICLSYEEKKQMGKNAREFVDSSFNRKTVTELYFNEINRIK